MTTKAAQLQSLVDAFDEHFRYNKKRPKVLTVQHWFVLQVAGMKRDMWRKAQNRIDARITERWPLI